MTKYYRDVSNNYMGAFSALLVDDVEPDHPDIDPAWVEVPTPPANGLDTWGGSSWVPDLEGLQEQKHVDANTEYVTRGMILTGAKARGSTPKQALNALAIKDTHRAGPNATTLANLHDKLELLKDAIEAAADQTALDAIDIADNSHWT